MGGRDKMGSKFEVMKKDADDTSINFIIIESPKNGIIFPGGITIINNKDNKE